MSGTAPKAQLIAQEVRRRIVEREWRQGDRIPDEAVLAVEYGAARATVNKALQMLADEGLLDRKRRAGTRVTVNPVRKATLTIPIAREQIERAGQSYSHRLIAQARVPAPGLVATAMEIPPGQPLIHLRAVHYGDGQPYQFEDRWIDPATVPGVESADFRRMSANEWLVRNAPYTRTEIAFRAENADARSARLLGARAGQAVLVLTRTTWNDAGPITHVRIFHHPGFTLSAL